MLLDRIEQQELSDIADKIFYEYDYSSDEIREYNPDILSYERYIQRLWYV